jgi:cytochrome c oxidase subunit 2
MMKSCRQPLAGLLALASALLGAPAGAESGWHLLNMPRGVTKISGEIYDLHMLIFWICVAIGVVVFGVMIYAIVKFRKSQGAVADTTMVHSTKAEIIWTVVPVMILVAMAVPSARVLIDIEDTRGSQLTIKVTGYQWKWQYDYLDEGISFFSTLDRKSDAARQLQSGVDPTSVDNYLLDVDNPLVVPENTKVRLLITAQDVIHAWWVPAFAMKKDAIPGFVNELWFKVESGKTGTYRGQCVELCGRDHGFMPIVVRVVTDVEFKDWVAAQRAKAAPPPAPAEEPADAAPAQAAVTPAAAPRA